MTSADFQQALQNHRAGNLRMAELLYQRSLESCPAEAEALHLLGVLCHQTGRRAKAVNLVKSAITLAPANPSYYNNLANILADSGQPDAALAMARGALKLAPFYPEAHNTIGNMLNVAGHRQRAQGSYQSALSGKPDLAEALVNLANLLSSLARPAEAARWYRRALRIRPDLPEAHNNLGNAYRQSGTPEESAASYRRAVLLRPGFAEGYANLGNGLYDLGRPGQALDCYQRALRLRPDLAEAHSNLGTLCAAQQRPTQAAAHLRAAVCCKPNYAEAYNNLGNALAARGLPVEGAKYLRRGISAQPDYPEALNNLGNVLKDQGDLDAAVDCYRQSLALRPEFHQAHSNLLMALSFHPACGPDSYLAEARRYGAKVAGTAHAYSHAAPRAANGDALRIGLVSGDLRTHPVGFFLEGVLSHLQQSGLQLHAYATNSCFDELSSRIRPHFVAWREIAGLSDAAAAQRIHDDGIQILMDLGGHTADNRLAVFAWKPAPVQCSWLGYFASTGLAEMDYLLADPVSAPPGSEVQFTETVRRLPDTRLCFTPPAADFGAPTSLPALRNGFVTFGCFQNLAKLNDAVLDAWGHIFPALPSARLRLQIKQAECRETREALRRRLVSAGLASSQIVIEGPTSRQDYLKAHGDVDVILDSFPYPGGTTTCEALWMGVPTLTLAGDTMLSRQGAALLAAAGLPEWIARDTDDYCRLAQELTADIDRLATLRATLRRQVRTSPLFDARRFAGHLKHALFDMWRAKLQSTTIR